MSAPGRNPPEAEVSRRRFSLIWLIPIAAAGIAIYLAWHTLAGRGPLITVTFRSAEGLVAGQTTVQFKAVDLGTVESIRISDDMSHVIVRIRMREEAEDHLTDKARFWIVRPRVTGGNISGLETLVSGAYIEFDPGPAGGESKRHFTGLEQPPSVRSDQEGTTFTLKTDRLGSLGIGAPIFFRDVKVGEVMSYDPPQLSGDITVHAFISQPYDSYVRDGTRFWTTSPVKVRFGPQGLQLQLQSVQTLISGGIIFRTPSYAYDQPPATAESVFRLYPDENAAEAAASPDQLDFLVYFDGGVRGLTAGAPVQLYGQNIGTVRAVKLRYDPKKKAFRVAVRFAVEPDPISLAVEAPSPNKLATARALAARGLRAQLQTTNFLTGRLAVALEFADEPDTAVRVTDGAIIVPAESGGMDNIVNSATDFMAKLNSLPLEQIGRNIDQTMASIKDLATSPDLKASLRSLRDTLASAHDLVRQADRQMGPALRRLPEIAEELQQTVTRTNEALGSINGAYGADSEFRRNLDRLMVEANDSARSIRLLAEFLRRHPEALIRGRSSRGAEQ